MTLIGTRALGISIISAWLLVGPARAQTPPTTMATDPMQRHRLAEELERQGKHAEALEHYLWCFDHGLEHDRAFYGVRLSFLLGNIKRLGETYPPAIDALRQRMQSAEQAILAGKGTPELAHDYASLCEKLDESSAAGETLKKLAVEGDHTLALREVIVDSLVGEFLRLKKPEFVLYGVGEDADEWIERQIAHARGVTEMMKQRAAESPEEAARVAFVGADFAVQDLIPYYSAFIQADRRELAQRLARRILEIDRSPRTVNGLVTAAREAGAPELADQLLRDTSTQPAAAAATKPG